MMYNDLMPLAAYPKKSPLVFVYLLSFFFTLHIAVPVYINSSFLGVLSSPARVGIIYSDASPLPIFTLYFIRRFLKSVGDFRATLNFLAAETATFFGLATLKDPVLLMALFIASYVLIYLISFDLDLIVESFSRNAKI